MQYDVKIPIIVSYFLKKNSDLFTDYQIHSIECDEAREEESDTNMEDLPVQGPLPQDPEDAPFRKNESAGIRKL